VPSARDLVSYLRYQILVPPETTMGPCSNSDNPTLPCDNIARGSGKCSECVMRELSKVTQNRALVYDLEEALHQAQEASLKIEELSSKLTNSA
jgi:hypothetical protein